MAEIIFVVGGARSGKSAHALELTEGFSRRIFIATAEAFDDEMHDRIVRHQAERGGGWETVEEPLDLAGAVRDIDDASAVAVVDCLTVWLGNLMHRDPSISPDSAPISAFLEALQNMRAARVIVVTNEVGMSIVPENALARRYRDLAGGVNQRVAAVADRLLLVVCGQVLTVKNKQEKG
jgi:adenosylcobinamide kinase / adenosylcobinamide-phosphate guanylyltransferase